MGPNPWQQAIRSWKASPPSPPRLHSSPAPWATRAPRAPPRAEPSWGTFSSRDRTRTRQPTCWRRGSSGRGTTVRATATTTRTRSSWALRAAPSPHSPQTLLNPTTATATTITMATITTTTTTPVTTTDQEPTLVPTITTPTLVQTAETTATTATETMTTVLTTPQTVVTMTVFLVTVHRLTTQGVVIVTTATGLHKVALKAGPTTRLLFTTLLLPAPTAGTPPGTAMGTAGTIPWPHPTAGPTPVLPPMTWKFSRSPTPPRQYLKDPLTTTIPATRQVLSPQTTPTELWRVSAHRVTTPLWTAGLT